MLGARGFACFQDKLPGIEPDMVYFFACFEYFCR